MAPQSRLRSDFQENHQKNRFSAQLPHSLELVVCLELSLTHLRDAYMLFATVSRRARAETEFCYEKLMILEEGGLRVSGAPEWHVASQSRLRSDFQENHPKYGFSTQLPHSLELAVPLELSLARSRDAYMLFATVSRRARAETEFCCEKLMIFDERSLVSGAH